MAEVATIAGRAGSIDGRHAGTPLASALPAPPDFRLNLRGGESAMDALEAALGLALPRAPKTSATAGLRSALWLGPDEWLVIEEPADGADALANPILDDLAGLDALHSAVDVSHRNTAVLVAGERVEDALSHGCPQDLSPDAFPVGTCSRTVLGKAEVVIWRGREDAFRVECWRSFAPYVMDFLSEAARDASL